MLYQLLITVNNALLAQCAAASMCLVCPGVSCRSGVKTVIFPEANRRDYEEVSSDLKEGMTPHFVTHYDQIFDLVLGGKEGLNSSSSSSDSSSSSSSSSSTK
jgi:hypothetical protein